MNRPPLCRALLCLALLGGAGAARAGSLEQLVDVEGIRSNQLTGYGIVVGLPGTGDGSQARYTSQSVKNMLNQFGVRMKETEQPRSRNTAAVIVSASFPPGYRKGQQIDVTVSSLGDAKSLRGGTLLMTPLRAADGEIYALAQGNLVIAGVKASGNTGSSVSINTATAGRIPAGATIEREIGSDFASTPVVRLNLKHPNFRTATNIVEAINRQFGANVADTQDMTSVEVTIPADAGNRSAFLARLTQLQVDQGEGRPRVVFNSRTGTVVISEGVTVRPAVVSHGTLKVTIDERFGVSQPRPFGNGQTVVTPQTGVDIAQPGAKTFLWKNGVKLQDIVDTINGIGATPDDLMAILEGLSEAGALDAELEVI